MLEAATAFGAIVLVLLAVLVVMLAIVLKRAAAFDSAPIQARLEGLERGQERTERTVQDVVARSREEGANQARGLREEVQASLKSAADSMVKSLGEAATAERGQLDGFASQLGKLTDSNEKRLEALRATVEQKLAQIQTENAAQLDEMRKTVDEKLEGTLEKRLGESFRLVSERLEQVYTGLGEMRSLASGVGDLKRVLTNVKTRGTWGEMALGNLLEQMLGPEQFARNVATREGSREQVEFAIKLPGPGSEPGDVVWLPIDAKFPKEDYERLIEAADRADADGVKTAGRDLERQIRASAKEIRDKYLNPPRTTDFGILFLPIEGLYAEVLQRPGLVDSLQREFRVTVAGPTTLAALLMSLQMGFRTLAIEKRSSEVWAILGAVKTEFRKFGDGIGKVKKKLEEAGNAIDDTAVRTRAIERKLRGVQELPGAEAAALLGDGGGAAEGPGDGAPAVEAGPEGEKREEGQELGG